MMPTLKELLELEREIKTEIQTRKARSENWNKRNEEWRKKWLK